VSAHYGASAAAVGLQVMETGHAGLTFGFRVVERAGAAPIIPNMRHRD